MPGAVNTYTQEYDLCLSNKPVYVEYYYGFSKYPLLLKLVLNLEHLVQISVNQKNI